MSRSFRFPRFTRQVQTETGVTNPTAGADMAALASINGDASQLLALGRGPDLEHTVLQSLADRLSTVIESGIGHEP